MLIRIQRVLESRLSLVFVLVAFLIAIGLTWTGEQSVAVADEVAYIVSGVNLVTTGAFVSSFGRPELWFPPVYPVLIGLLSVGGRIDPFLVARIISVAASLGCLLLVYALAIDITERLTASADESIETSASGTRRTLGLSAKLAAVLATALLAFNPNFQLFASRALSESLALVLLLAAFRFWLVAGESFKGVLATGTLVGLATLTRPECVLVLPVWFAIDVLRYRSAAACGRALLAGLAIAAILTPYVLYLHQHTGEWNISQKGPVNLAAGRASFHQTPREYIDESTLELGYFPVDVSTPVEARRHVANFWSLVDAFGQMYYRPALAFGMWGLISIGIVILYARGQSRIVFGLIATTLYLAVVLHFDPQGPKTLFMVVPAASLLAAIAVTRGFMSQRWLGVLPSMGLLSLVLLEGSTRHPRWKLSEPQTANVELRVAGKQLRDMPIDRGVMYEYGATVAYYSGMTRRYLTPNTFETILLFIEKHEPAGVPVYLTVASGTSPKLHESVQRLLNEPHPALERVLEIDSPKRVVVYRVIRSGQVDKSSAMQPADDRSAGIDLSRRRANAERAADSDV